MPYVVALTNDPIPPTPNAKRLLACRALRVVDLDQTPGQHPSTMRAGPYPTKAEADAALLAIVAPAALGGSPCRVTA